MEVVVETSAAVTVGATLWVTGAAGEVIGRRRASLANVIAAEPPAVARRLAPRVCRERSLAMARFGDKASRSCLVGRGRRLRGMP